METHVKVLGALNIVYGVFGLLGAVLLVFIFGGAASIAGASGDPEAVVAVPVIGLTGMAIVAFVVMLSVPGIIVGIGLFNFRPWARITGIVVSILSLIVIPFGTILGVYGIWVLFSKETERLFTPASTIG